jgi:hypothetical protein
MRPARAPVDSSHVSQLLEMDAEKRGEKVSAQAGSGELPIDLPSVSSHPDSSSIGCPCHPNASASFIESFADANGLVSLMGCQGGRTEVRFAAAASERLAICLENIVDEMCEMALPGRW